ncbi:MAG: carboxypeptidase-like regulatory domain-containing protein, partial [Dysgonamonadaceae bacterium]|nr:carboxypeptidase-like regulatory domain-containing protein [Dysgonamonadaceae bacterium]
IELQEVEVLSWKNPADLVEAAARKITQNYSLTPNLLTCFYRETIQKRKKYITVSEAVTEVYKSSYQKDALGDRAQILKGRKLLSPEKKDTLGVKLLGGPNLAIYVDVVKNSDILLDAEALTQYAFKMGEITSINNRLQYVVHFRPQIIAPYPLYEGTYYIDRETLAFTRIVFSMEMRDKEKVTRIILKDKPAGLRFTPDEVSYVVTYQYQNGMSYLSYIRDEIRFRCDWKRRLFSTPYTVISEMVVTDRRAENIEKIATKKAFSERKSLSDEAMSYYDSNFWGAYNIIEPTESLESAVGKLKKEESVE